MIDFLFSAIELNPEVVTLALVVSVIYGFGQAVGKFTQKYIEIKEKLDDLEQQQNDIKKDIQGNCKLLIAIKSIMMGD